MNGADRAAFFFEDAQVQLFTDPKPLYYLDILLYTEVYRQ